MTDKIVVGTRIEVPELTIDDLNILINNKEELIKYLQLHLATKIIDL